jgi:fibronectin-binding autotransporter adhesin
MMPRPLPFLRKASATAALSLAALAFAGLPANAQSVWNFPDSGNWSDNTATGWNGTGVPNAVGATATIQQNITANEIMNLDIAPTVTLGSLTFGDTSNTWTIEDTGGVGSSFTFDATSGNATLSSTAPGTVPNTISVPISLTDTLDVTLTSGRLGLNGVISGNGGLTLVSGDRMFLGGTAANTYAGLTTINGGRLELSKTAGVNAIAGNVLIDGATAQLFNANSNTIADTSDITIDLGEYLLNGKGETVDDVTVNGGKVTSSINGSSGSALAVDVLTLNGGQAVITNNNNANASMTANSVVITQPTSGAYTAIAMTSGTTRQAALNLNGNLTYNGDAGNSNSVSITNIASSTEVSNIVLSQATTTLTVGNGGADVDLIIQPRFLKAATGTQALTKDGLGTLELDGVSTYTGATTVSAGRLLVHGGLATASATTVSSGASFGGKGAIGALTVSSGGGYYDTLSKATPGSQPVADTDYFQTNVTGAVTLSGGDFQLTIGTGFEAGDIFYLIANDAADAIAGTFTTLNGATTDLSQGATFTSGGQTFQISYTADTTTSAFSGTGNDLALQVVPEPQTWVTLLSGLGMLLGFQRRRRLLS